MGTLTYVAITPKTRPAFGGSTTHEQYTQINHPPYTVHDRNWLINHNKTNFKAVLELSCCQRSVISMIVVTGTCLFRPNEDSAGFSEGKPSIWRKTFP